MTLTLSLSLRLSLRLSLSLSLSLTLTKVKLHGELCFPNLTFDVAKVDLGSVLNDQPRSTVVTITNPSRVEARYTWCFASQQDTPKLFDVLPIRGLLLPGSA